MSTSKYLAHIMHLLHLVLALCAFAITELWRPSENKTRSHWFWSMQEMFGELQKWWNSKIWCEETQWFWSYSNRWKRRGIPIDDSTLYYSHITMTKCAWWRHFYCTIKLMSSCYDTLAWLYTVYLQFNVYSHISLIMDVQVICLTSCMITITFLGL